MRCSLEQRCQRDNHHHQGCLQWRQPQAQQPGNARGADNAPRLNKPWKPDIMVLPLARSTITACKLTVESTVPKPAPNRNNPAINNGIELTVASIGRAMQIISVPAVSTRRQP